MLQNRIIEFNRVILLLLTQNGNAGFEIRGLDVDSQTTFKTGNEAFFESADFAGGPIRG